LRSTEVEKENRFSLRVSSTADIVPRLLSAFLSRVSHGGRVHLAIFRLIYSDLCRKILYPFPNSYHHFSALISLASSTSSQCDVFFYVDFFLSWGRGLALGMGPVPIAA